MYLSSHPFDIHDIVFAAYKSIIINSDLLPHTQLHLKP